MKPQKNRKSSMLKKIAYFFACKLHVYMFGSDGPAKSCTQEEKKTTYLLGMSRALVNFRPNGECVTVSYGQRKDHLNVCQLTATDEWVQTETNSFEWVERKCTLPAIVRNTLFSRSFCFCNLFNAIYLARTHRVSSGWVGSVLLCVAPRNDEV